MHHQEYPEIRAAESLPKSRMECLRHSAACADVAPSSQPARSMLSARPPAARLLHAAELWSWVPGPSASGRRKDWKFRNFERAVLEPLVSRCRGAAPPVPGRPVLG